MRDNFKHRSVAGILFCCIALLIAGCSKKDAVGTADAFFGLLRQDKVKEAYDSAAFAFQAQQSIQRFEAMSKELGLVDFQSLTWERKVIKENEAKLDGKILQKGGGEKLVALTLIKESGHWRVYSLRTQGAGEEIPTENRFSLVGKGADFSDAYKRDIPSEEQVKALVKETLVKFNAAVQQKNFDDFYNYISVGWQNQVSQKRLTGTFQGFIDEGINMSGVKNAEIVFDQPPQTNGFGLLVVKGHCEIKPFVLVFSLTYVYELPKWRLFGIDVNCLEK
jgi:hypothetical protein